MAVYTTIDDPSEFFQATTYTGNGGNGHVITHTGNSDLQADMVWVKMRNAAYNQVVYDTNRRPSGTPFSGSLYMLSVGNNYGAGAENTGAYGPTAIGSNSVTMNSYDTINLNNKTFVAWNWKANGGTTASNTDGSLTSTVQANQDAGFSIVTYTAADSDEVIGHGLGVTPDVIIIKRRDAGSSPWTVFFPYLTSTNKQMYLNQTTALDTNNVKEVGASTFRVSGWQAVAVANGTYVAYCFASKQGYSKFGSYVGNGNANGTFVYTGFKPAFIMVKTTAVSDEWNIYDTKRSGSNPNNDAIYASNDVVEDAGSTYAFMDIVSNGFKLRRATHSPNKASTYIYMAFAEQPFVTSTGTPATAR
jgi:hypothetical protein